MNPVRIAHISDSHAYEPQLDEWLRVHMQFSDQIRDVQPDVVIHSGDLFHRRSTVAERNAVVDWLFDVAETAPVVIVRGNHDAPGDLLFLERLGTRHDVYVRETPDVIDLDVLAVVCVPWFDKSEIAARASGDDTAQTVTERAIAAARMLMAWCRAECADARERGLLPVLAGHVEVAGSETSTGQTLVGRSVELSPGDLRDTGAAYCAIGHIHKAQDWYDGRVRYAGSPWRQNMGERELKSWTLVDVDGEEITVREQKLGAREIIAVDVDLTADADPLRIVQALPGTLTGAIVRVRYQIRPQNLHVVVDDEIRRTVLNCGAHECRVEGRVVHEARVRSEAIRNARDTWERLLAYWDATGTDLTDEDRERVRQMLGEIALTSGREERDHAAA